MTVSKTARDVIADIVIGTDITVRRLDDDADQIIATLDAAGFVIVRNAAINRTTMETRTVTLMFPAEGRPTVFWCIPRDKDALECKCGGYAGRVDCTSDECKEFGCGRDFPGRECCARAFVCKVCGTRYSGKAEAPEMG